MRILHILLGKEFGGATVMVRLLCQYQMARGHDVQVLSSNVPRSIDEFLRYGIPLAGDKPIAGTISLASDAFHLFNIVRLIKSNHYDVVHTHAVKAGLMGRPAARLAGTEHIVHSTHGYGFQEKFRRSPLLRHLYIFIERRLSTISSVIIVPSDGEHDIAMRYALASRTKVTRVYNGIDVAAYGRLREPANRWAARRSIGVTDNETLIGTIGRLHRSKGHSYLIRAAAALLEQPGFEAKFVCIGDGPERDRLRSEIEQYRLGPRFVLLSHRDDISEVMHAMDIFVLPSLREGFGIVLLEAMAAARPCIATDVGGPAEVVRHGVTGFVVPPADPIALEQAMKALIADPDLRHRMGQEGLTRARTHFTSDLMGQQILEAYSRTSNPE